MILKKKINSLVINDSYTIQNDNEYLWNEYSKNKSSNSILNYIDENSEKIRKEFLNWSNYINQISENNKKIDEYFIFYEKFSFWWLTDFVEKNFYKKNKFTEIIKIIALNFLIDEKKIKSIELTSENVHLINIFKNLCKKKKIRFFYKRENKKKNYDFKNIVKKICPKIIWSLIFLIYIGWIKIFIKKTKIKYDKNKNLFISFFVYFNEKSIKNGIFKSDFWGDLQRIEKGNWAQLFLKSSLIKSEITANKYINNLNQKNHKLNNSFFFIDSFFNIKIFFKILFYWFVIINKFLWISEFKKKIKLKNGLDLWPILKKDLFNDFLGPQAILKLYYFFTFEEFFKKNKFNSKCFYLFENQPYEKSLIYFWKKYNKNKIFGVVHSTVRFWDLRFSKYFRKKNFFLKSPYPDFLLSNGVNSQNRLVELNHSKNSIIKVEALRYKTVYRKNIQKKVKLKNILILGDYSDLSNENLIKIIEKVNFKKNLSVFLKPHKLKNFYIKNSSLKILNLKRNIDKIKKTISLAIVTNTTSASVDLYLRGVKVIVLLDKNSLNMSPLKKIKNIDFISNHYQLEELINKKIFKTYKINNNFFQIDKNLKSWKKILKK
tara:strand:- start:4991 stop:6799 length:1809 start_codon:yes stop_codon:yes gene_type:complete